jgi:hypothetical protein
LGSASSLQILPCFTLSAIQGIRVCAKLETESLLFSATSSIYSI